MSYGRLTIATALEGEESRVAEVMDRLAAYYRQQKGSLAQYCFYRSAHDGRVFKAGVWTTKAAADHAAQSQESMALRSLLLGLTEGHPEEMSFDVSAGSGLGLAQQEYVYAIAL